MKSALLRSASLLLALLMALPLASCGSDEATSTDTQASTDAVETTVAVTTEEKLLPDLPEVSYDGADFRFYNWDFEDRREWNEIDSEGEDGEPINDAVFKRNTYIEETYDIVIQSSQDLIDAFQANIKKLISADEDAYEVIIPLSYSVYFLYGNDVFYNLLDLDYVDFTQPWWDAASVEEFTLAGYLPFVSSDMIILDKRSAGAVFYNKKVADDFGVGSLYQTVYDGKWTMDKLAELGKKVSEDIDGDGEYDDDDRYGIITEDTAVVFFFHSAGCRFVTKDDEGYPVYSFESEYNYTAIKHYCDDIIFDPMLTRNNSFVANAKTHENMFMQNQGLFYIGGIGAANTFREMEADFGILPIPKYLESQEGYQTSVNIHGASIIGVPLTNRNLDMTGVILEAMAAESKYTLIPAFYEKVLKDKASRDADSEAMLDIIVDSMVYDVGYVYSIGYFPDYFVRITGNANKAGHGTYPTQTSDMASFYKKYEKMLGKEVDKLIKIIDKWNDR